MRVLCKILFACSLVLACPELAHADEPLIIERGQFKADGLFELSVKGPPQTTFFVEFSTDGKTFTGLEQAAESGFFIVFYTCDEKGECTAYDQEAGQSLFRFYRLQVFVMPTEGFYFPAASPGF